MHVVVARRLGLGGLSTLRILPPDPSGTRYYRDVFGSWFIIFPSGVVDRLADEVACAVLLNEGYTEEVLIHMGGREMRQLARELGYPIPRSAK